MRISVDRVEGTLIIRGRVEEASSAGEAIDAFDQYLYDLGLRYVESPGEVTIYANPTSGYQREETSDYRCIFITGLRSVTDFGRLLEG